MHPVVLSICEMMRQDDIFIFTRCNNDISIINKISNVLCCMHRFFSSHSNVGELCPCVVRHGSFVHTIINNFVTFVICLSVKSAKKEGVLEPEAVSYSSASPTLSTVFSVGVLAVGVWALQRVWWHSCNVCVRAFDNNIIRGFHLKRKKRSSNKRRPEERVWFVWDSKVAKDGSVFRLISYSNSYSLGLSSLASFLCFL